MKCCCGWSDCILATNEVIGEEGGKDVAQSYPASPESHYLQSQFSPTRVAAGLTRQLGLKPRGSQGMAEWSTYLERTQGLYDLRSVTSGSRLRSVDQYDYPCLSLSIHHSSCVRGKMIWRSTEKSREQGLLHTWSAELYNVARVQGHSPQAPSATPDHEDNPHCAVIVPLSTTTHPLRLSPPPASSLGFTCHLALNFRTSTLSSPERLTLPLPGATVTPHFLKVSAFPTSLILPFLARIRPKVVAPTATSSPLRETKDRQDLVGASLSYQMRWPANVQVAYPWAHLMTCTKSPPPSSPRGYDPPSSHGPLSSSPAF